MSKLADRIRRALRVESQPIGFGASARTSNPTLLLAAFLPSPSPEAAKNATDRGADTCLVTASDPEDDQVTQLLQALADLPCGLRAPRLDAASAAHLAELGVDYAALDPQTALATALLDSNLGIVLTLEDDLPDTYLRTIETLPIDAILLPQLDLPLTVRRHIELQRISWLARKPLIVPVPPQVTAPELQMMREAAVAAVGVDADSDALLDTLASLRRQIDELPPRQRPREDESDALLPRLADAVAAAQDDDEDDDEVWETNSYLDVEVNPRL